MSNENENAVINERARIEGILKLEQQYNVDLGDLVKNGAPVEKAYAVILEKIDNNAVKLQPPVNLNKKEMEEYSLRKVFLNRIDPNKYELGIEKDISQELAQKMDLGDGVVRGIVVPHNIFSRKLDNKRALTAGSPAGGGYTVGTDHLGIEFIDLLRNEMVCLRAGVRVMAGLRGNIDIPKLIAGVTMAWGTETTIVTEQNPVFGTVTMSPKSGAALVNASLQLLLQSDPTVELLLQNDLLQSIALGLDHAILHGTGTEQPTGIANTSNIGSVIGAGLSSQKLLEFITNVKTANAANNLRWITNPTIESLCRQREKVSGYPDFLMSPDGKLSGYESLITNQVAAGTLFFGDFTQAILGLWGGIDILRDPYTSAASKTVRFFAFQFADVAVRIPGAFSVANGVN
jgi:HK97 family phage major capsid protein